MWASRKARCSSFESLRIMDPVGPDPTHFLRRKHSASNALFGPLRATTFQSSSAPVAALLRVIVLLPPLCRWPNILVLQLQSCIGDDIEACVLCPRNCPHTWMSKGPHGQTNLHWADVHMPAYVPGAKVRRNPVINASLWASMIHEAMCDGIRSVDVRASRFM